MVDKRIIMDVLQKRKGKLAAFVMTVKENGGIDGRKTVNKTRTSGGLN